MRHRRRTRTLTLLLIALALCTSGTDVFAQRKTVNRSRRPNAGDLEKAAAEARGTTDAAVVREFWRRYDRVQTELVERKIRLPQWPGSDGRVAAIIDKAHVGLFATEDGPTRYLALHLQIGNETPQAVAIPRDRIRAVIDGNPHPTQEIGPRLVQHGFPYGGEYFALEACQPAKELTPPARGVAGTWLVYPGLPVGQTLPACQIAVQIGDRSLEVPANAVQRALLDMNVERLGPHRTLALIQLGGLLNTFNLYALVDEVDALAAQKTNRLVLQWKPNAPQPDGQLLNWLQNSALGMGSGRPVSEQLPAFPAALRELHLVEAATGMFLAPEYTSHPQAPPKVHASAALAVAAALRSMYVALPRDELLAELRRGHALSRAAALVHGAPRLDLADLPLVIEFSQGTDPAVRHAALMALGDFDRPAALDRLEAALRSDDEADRNSAAVALSESRYQGPRDRFRDILAASDGALQGRIVTVLAQRPRAEWADLLARHARDDKGRLQIDIVRALVQLNDSRIVGLLAPALGGNDKSLQDFAFQILSESRDERAERLAADFVLERLRTTPPDAQVMTFLGRTKDPRAIPLLLKHLESASDKASLINLLGQIGDSPVGDALVSRFDKWAANEQIAVLNALRQLRHPRFVEVAGRALSSKQDVIVSHAIQGLAQQDGREAERLLCAALESATRPTVLDNLALTVANLGTPAARQALRQARSSSVPQRRAAGLKGLQRLIENSPGWSACEQGHVYAREEKWSEALDAFTLAAQLDPQLPEAYTGQGDVHLKRSRYEQAEQAFAEAYRLDSTNGLACCGLAIAQLLLGRLDAGRETVEKVRAQFPQDVNYSYNAACFYGRAVEAIARQPESAERDAQLAKYREQALSDLRDAVKLGFRDADWMQKDPDLKSLHELPDFQKIASDAAARKDDR